MKESMADEPLGQVGGTVGQADAVRAPRARDAMAERRIVAAWISRLVGECECGWRMMEMGWAGLWLFIVAAARGVEDEAVGVLVGVHPRSSGVWCWAICQVQ